MFDEILDILETIKKDSNYFHQIFRLI